MSNVISSAEGIAGQASHRKLHFFWLVDISGSMGGNKIQCVNWAIKQVLPEIQHLEDEERIRVFMSAIKFGDRAEWHGGGNPVEVSRFTWEDLDATGGYTSTAHAIELLCGALDVEKIGRRNVPPVCIPLSDGYCTDPEERYNRAIKTINSLPWGVKAVRLSIGIGGREDYNKEQLDQFITPYLRKENGVETLPADSPRKLVEYIILSTTTAVIKSTNSGRDTNQNSPVDLSMADLNDGTALDPENLPDPNEVYWYGCRNNLERASAYA